MFLVLRGVLRIGRAEADGALCRWVRVSSLSFPEAFGTNTSAAEETWVALIETTTTLHTGSEQTAMTGFIAEQLGWSTKWKLFALKFWCISYHKRFALCGVRRQSDVSPAGKGFCLCNS
jgi:hypothetical protein